MLFAADMLPLSVPFVLFPRQRDSLLIQHLHRGSGESCHVSVGWETSQSCPGNASVQSLLYWVSLHEKGAGELQYPPVSSPSEIFKGLLLLMVPLLKAQIFSGAIVTDAVGEMKQVEILLPEFEGFGVLSLFL